MLCGIGVQSGRATNAPDRLSPVHARVRWPSQPVEGWLWPGFNSPSRAFGFSYMTQTPRNGPMELKCRLCDDHLGRAMDVTEDVLDAHFQGHPAVSPTADYREFIVPTDV